MPEYAVKMTKEVTYIYFVEADTESEALEAASLRWETGDNGDEQEDEMWWGGTVEVCERDQLLDSRIERSEQHKGALGAGVYAAMMKEAEKVDPSEVDY